MIALDAYGSEYIRVFRVGDDAFCVEMSRKEKLNLPTPEARCEFLVGEMSVTSPPYFFFFHELFRNVWPALKFVR